MPNIRCPKCKSTNTYYDDDGMMACIKCAERFPLFGKIESISNPKITEESMAEETKKKRSKSKLRPCRNCGRVKKIIGDDLCGGCYFAVRIWKKGTPVYDQRLADAKKRFTDPEKKATKQLENLTVTDVMKAERDLLLDRVQRLNTAIELLS
jgi:hypothetical protein